MPKASTSKAAVATKPPNKKPPVKRKANAYQMPESIPLGEIMMDLSKQQWKIGPSIGTGGFGEIYCACKSNESTKKYEDYSYVVKVVSVDDWKNFFFGFICFSFFDVKLFHIIVIVTQEPHGNGPLFVEMHFYMRNGKLADSK